mmetsp:Transcript_12685/g.18988  ORF Transcript_12685/g.18988 Transcript_12685/m.18988 type:complete len:116 (-) Transcript_12685:45-392(-)
MKFITKRSFWDQDKLREWIIYVLRYWMILLLILLYLLRKVLIKLGWVEAKVDDTMYRLDEDGNYRPTPPFFVAMPRGRRLKEEMTIQHMYDLFGGYGGGGGQVATANDRKATGKK